MRSSRLSCSLLLSILLIGVASSASADPPRGPLKTSPRIGGREVKELVLTAPVQMGEPLPPGLPTVRTYTISPNRFAPVSEDVNAVYYQADGTFAEGNHDTGGLRVSKAYPDQSLHTGETRGIPTSSLSAMITSLQPMSEKSTSGSLAHMRRTRVRHTNRPNQAMQRTAGRSAF